MKSTSGITATVETITPAQAQKWLENNNPENRPLNRHAIETLSDSILNGEWALNGQTISFDTNNVLQNGQTRLSAIVRADTAVEVLVVRGVAPEARPTVDVGRKRTVADEFTIRGEDNPKTAASILMMIKKIDIPSGRGRNVALTTVDAIRLLDEYPDVREASALAVARRTSIDIPPSVIGYCTMHFRRLDKALDNEFWDVFLNAQFEGANDPRFVLQKTMNRLAKDTAFSTGAFVNKVYQAALTIKAWNAYHQERSIALLKYVPKNESFPTAV